MRHHAFVIEASANEGIEIAQKWLESELGLHAKGPSTRLGAGNPDVVTLRYGLFSVADARRVNEIASQAPISGSQKAIIIAASRAYHEAQNALLKLFEEPPAGTYLFLILPSLGGILPTLSSRVQVIKHEIRNTKSGKIKKHEINPAEEFMKASKEKRSAMIKKLASGKDDEQRRELRDEAIAIVDGIEAIAYSRGGLTSTDATALLSDVATLRGYLHDRSAPVRMILEHLSLVIPKNLS
ncbi:hypothetical protein A2678_01240 [Candidatus Kaiserbacteria bacterium RIFCSPHIGHO2_01_FULL_53_31]|uniref:DNA polymerase III subunit delta n=1 Tax=Candidatus Kaiserbacteria bacterium RIFCSPHIGHO2_01_FULL_53_31 TaxID=1798481 RepID=A0A1F6CJL9_9BACT|nr:MAG: hypothetical protein A2678_01240 [Candidatus Kaiserbacteria bacterium RIFCSPHIGHO2_01_FULL_53_31]